MYSRLISGGKKIFLAMILLLAGINGYAATFTTSATGNWSAAGTWVASNSNRTGTVSASNTSTAVIGTGTLFTTELSVGSVIQRQNGTLIGTVASITDNTNLTLTGSASNTTSGSYRRSDGPGGAIDNVVIASGHSVTVNGNYKCASLGINNGNATAILTFATSGSPSLSVTGVVNVGNPSQANQEGTITFTSGSTLIAGSLSLGTVVNQTSSINMTAGGTLKVNGIITSFTGSTWTPGAGTVELTANNTLPATIITSFNNLIISGGTTTLGVALNSTATGTITVKAGATLALGNNNNRSFGATTAPSSVVLETGTTGSIITGTGTNILHLGGNVTVNNTTGSSGATISCPIALDGNRTFTVADDGTSAVDLSISGAISTSYGLIKSGAGTMELSGINLFTGGVTLNTGTLNINNNQALGTAAGTFTIAGGTIDATTTGITTVNYPLALNDDFTFTGTYSLNLGAGAVTMNADRIITTTTIGNTLTLGGTIASGSNSLTKAGAGVLSFGSNTVTLSGLNIDSGTLTSTSGTMNLAGYLTNNSTFSHNNGTVIFNGLSQIIGGSNSITFNNLTISSSTSTTLGINTLVAGNLNVTTDDLFDLNIFTCNRTASGGTLTVAGTLLLGGTAGGQGASNFPSGFTAFTMTGGTVNYNNSTGGQTIYSIPTYATLTLGNTSGTQSAGGNITANVLNNTNATDIFNMGTNTLTVTTPNNTGTIRTQNTSDTPISSGKTWGGTVTFDGTTAQTIPASNFNNLTLNNALGASLGGTVNIGGTLALTSGILTTTGTNLLNISNTSSSAIATPSATSYLNGPLKWSLASGSSYTFPVGKGTSASTYYPINLNGITGTTPVVQMEAFATGPSGTADGTTLTSLSSTEYWLLTKVSGTFSGATVDLTRQTPVSPLENIGRSTNNAALSYSSIGGTAGGNSITGSNNTGVISSTNYFAMAQRPKIYNIASNNSFSGANSYCQNAASPTALTSTFNTCSTGSGSSVATTVTVTWYYNTTNSTTVAGATQVSQTTGASTGTSATVIYPYTPSTTTAGTFYYFAVLSSPSNTSCGFNPTLSTGTQLVTVNALPTPTLISSDSDNTFCDGASVTFTAGGGTNYNFRVGGSSVQNGSGTTYTTSSLTNGQVVDVIVTNVSGCSATSTGITNTVTAAGTWLGTTSTDWNIATNWCGGVPTASTNVIISSGGNQPVIGAAGGLCNNMTINAGATLSVTGSNALTVSGNWSNSGTFTSNSSTVIFNGAAQTVGIGPFYNLTLAGSGVKTTTGTTVNGTLSMEGTATVSVAPTYGTAATLQYKGGAAQTSGNEFPATFSGTGGVVINNSNGVSLVAAKSIGSSSKLTLTNGILTTTSTNLLSVTNTSTTAISGGSATSFINGPVKWSLPAGLVSGSTYNFPVGKGTTYLPFSLVNPTAGTGAVAAQVDAFTGNSGGSPNATITSLSNSEYWSLVTTGNFTNSSLTISRPSAISPLDEVSGSTTLTGSYTSLNGTTGTNGVANSDAIGANRFFTLAAKKSTITTITINGSPFCAGVTGVSVPFTYDPKANFSGATFTAQLSDATGAFTSPVTLENVASNGTGSQSLNVTIPLGTVPGTGYRIRIVSTSPSVTGSDNGADLIISGTVAAQPEAITPSTTTPCANTAGVTYTVTNVAGVTYIWTFPNGWIQTGGGTTNSVTVTTGTASGNVVVTPSNSCGSGTPQTLAVSVIPIPAITVQPSTTPQSVCQDGTLTALSVTATGATAYQWYKNVTESNSGGTLLTGATNSSYLPLSNTAGTLYYYCMVSGACSPLATSDVSGAVTVVVPERLAATPTSRCGTGTLSLSVTRSGCLPSSTVDWYSDATGGTPLVGGTNTTSYTTPSPGISTTTTFYAQETFHGGLITPGTVSLGTNGSGLVFDLNEQIVLDSVQVYAITAGSVTIQLQNNAGSPISTKANINVVAGINTIGLTWTIPAGTGYRLVKTAGVNLGTTTTTPSSWPVGFNVGSITSSIEAGSVYSLRYDYFYNWRISRVRVPVIATVGSPIISGFSGSSCGPGTVVLGASTSAGTIHWYDVDTGGTPIPTGTPFTTPSLSATTTYYIDATDNGCTSSRIPVTASIITKPTITATGNGSYCSGSTVNLSSSGTGITNKYWTGPNGYYSLRDSVLTGVTSAITGTYTVIGSALSNINLIYNGDFESGNVGFVSSYTYRDSTYNDGTGYGALGLEGVYTVVINPISAHSNFSQCADHTTSGKKQMVVNGATVANVNIWSQTVNVVPNTDYQYTYWIQSVVASNPARLQLYINGSPAGPIYQADTPTCSWRQFTYNWNSGSSTSAYLSLVNQNVVGGGNDFALDDIVFRPACTTEDPAHATADPNIMNGGENAAYGVIYVTVNAVPTAGVIGTNQSICSGVTPATLTSTTAGTGSGTISYEWQTNASGSYVTIPGATSATYSPPPLTATTSYRRSTVTTNYGRICTSAYTNVVIITVTGSATAIAGSPDAVCQSSSPAPITLSGASVGGSATTGAWSILTGGGSLSDYSQTATPAAVTYTPAANYSGTVTLRLTTNNSGGCSAIADRTITVRPTPTASISGTTSVCQNSTNPTVTFTNPQAFPVTISYNINGLNQTTINVGANATATVAAPTSASGPFAYNLESVVYLTAPTCSNAISGTATVTVNPTLTADITGGITPICSNITPGTFTATGGGGTGAYTYLWYKDGISTGVTTPTYAPGSLTATSTFYCAITSGPCGPLNTSTTTITVNALPDAPTAGNVTVTYDGLPHTGTATPPAGSSIAWYDASTGGSTTVAPVGTTAGVYSAWAESVSSTGCKSSTRTLVTVTISKATITVTADNASRAYGAANPTFTATYTGFVNGQNLGTSGITGSPALTTTATTSSAVGTYTITSAVGTLASTNYQFSNVNGTLTVTAAALTVTAIAQTKTYGGTLSTTGVLNTTFSVTGLQTGDVVSGATLGYSGNPTGDLATAVVGSYTITPSAITLSTGSIGNYTITYNTATLTVAKATITVTADNKSKVYGVANPAFTATYAGFVNGQNLGTSGITGSPALTTTATTSSAVGTYTITSAVGTLASTNYQFSYVNGTLTVTAAALTVTAIAQIKTYGGTLSTTGVLNTTFSVTGLQTGDVVSGATLGYSGNPAGNLATAAVGSYTITPSAITLSTGSIGNYIITYNTATLTVGKASITVTADNKNKAYGVANPAFTATYTGFVNGQNLGTSGITGSPALTTTATTSSAVGTYTITSAVGTLASTNYQFSYVNGTLTVTGAALTVTAIAQTKTYGGTLSTTGVLNTTFSVTGLQTGDVVSGATLGYSGSPAGNVATAAVGSYTITPSAVTLSTGSIGNYTITYATGILTVGKAAITITANNVNKSYGTALTGGAGSNAYTITSGALQNGELPTVTITYGTGAAATAAAGTYNTNAVVPSSATGGGFTTSNYDITYVNGNIVVGVAAITIKANNVNKTYGTLITGGSGSNAYTITSGTLQNGENPTVTITYGVGAASTAGVGTYSTNAVVPSAATGGGFTASNYAITWVNGNILVGAAAITIKASDATKIYGTSQSTPVLGSSAYTIISGTLQNSETIGSLTLTYGAGALLGTSPVGSTSVITPSAPIGGTFTESNYNITYSTGILTVVKANLTIIANNATKVYGGTLTGGTSSTAFTSSGLQNGETIGSVTITYGTGALATDAAGTYTGSVTPSAATGGIFSTGNYTITYTKGDIVVSTIPLTITANNQMKCVGNIFNFTGSEFSSIGLINSDVISSVTLTSSGSSAGAAVGTILHCSQRSDRNRNR